MGTDRREDRHNEAYSLFFAIVRMCLKMRNLHQGSQFTQVMENKAKICNDGVWILLRISFIALFPKFPHRLQTVYYHSLY